MPLSGTFLADFASFDDAAKRSVIHLTSMETGGAKVERQLNRMADSFSGKKIISDATLMARVFTDAGGAATFTTAELQRMGIVGAEAMEKLRKTGQPIPEQLMAMGRATRSLGDAAGGGGGAAGKVDKFALSVGQADAMLGRFGVNLPPEVRGLADLASSSVTSGGALTTLGTAALVAGAGFAGWKVGAWIGGVTGLTQSIADGTAAALGWGDAIGQRAAAKGDLLARASKTAGRSITDVTEAMVINQAEAERLIAKNIKTSASYVQLGVDAAKAAAIIASNNDKIRKSDHDLAVALTDADNDRRAKAEADARAKRLAETGYADAPAPIVRQPDGSYTSAPPTSTPTPTTAGTIVQNPDGSYTTTFPHFARGVENFRGGPAWVGEDGPELLDLPPGSSVTSNQRALQRRTAGSGGTTIISSATYISGVFDPASKDAIGKVVASSVGRAVLRGRG